MAETATLPETTSILPIAAEASRLASDELTGEERAAILLLALGKDYGEPIWESLEDDEIAEISIAMSKLGKVTTDQVEEILARFISDMSISGAVMGNFESTESLLKQILPEDRVNLIMEGIRGPAGRNSGRLLAPH